MKTVTVYGIPNCDTTKKTIAWLKSNNINFDFHDYKQKGITKQKLELWCKQCGWEAIFNKRSTSWRELSAGEQNKIINQDTAIQQMLQNNSIIKRPVIEYNNKLIIGFKETEISKQLK